MVIFRWNPFRDLAGLRWLDESFGTAPENGLREKDAPPAHLQDTDKEILILVGLPGNKEKDGEPEVEDYTLTLKGSMPEASELKPQKVRIFQADK